MDRSLDEWLVECLGECLVVFAAGWMHGFLDGWRMPLLRQIVNLSGQIVYGLKCPGDKLSCPNCPWPKCMRAQLSWILFSEASLKRNFVTSICFIG